MSIQENENSFFACYLKVVLDDSISHYYGKSEVKQYQNYGTCWDCLDFIASASWVDVYKLWCWTCLRRRLLVIW